MIVKRSVIFLATSMLMTVLGCEQYASSKTEVSDKYLSANFKKVGIGDTVEDVYKIVGPPLWITINTNVTGDGAYHQYRSSNTNLGAVLMLGTNVNSEISFTYSQPKTAGKNYLLYYIRIQDMKVVKKEGPLIMD